MGFRYFHEAPFRTRWNGIRPSLLYTACNQSQMNHDKLMPETSTRPDLLLARAKDFLQRAPEIAVFGVCCVMVDELRDLQRACNDGKLTMSGFLDKSNAVLGQFVYTAAATERFGVVMPVIEYGQFSPFFWRWFNWWDDYFRALTPTQVNEIELLARGGMATANDFRPTGHWVQYRETPAFTILKD